MSAAQFYGFVVIGQGPKSWGGQHEPSAYRALVKTLPAPFAVKNMWENTRSARGCETGPLGKGGIIKGVWLPGVAITP